MPVNMSRLENNLSELLELKSKHGLGEDKFLLMLGMMNLMGLINLLEARSVNRGGRSRRSITAADTAPFVGIFGGPKNKPLD